MKLKKALAIFFVALWCIWIFLFFTKFRTGSVLENAAIVAVSVAIFTIGFIFYYFTIRAGVKAFRNKKERHDRIQK